MPGARSGYIIERAIFYHTSELFKLSKRGAVILVSSKLMLTKEPPSSSAIDEDLLSKRMVLTSRLAHIRCVLGLSLMTGCSKLFDIFASVQPVAEHFFGGGDTTSTMTEGCSMDSQGVSRLITGRSIVIDVFLSVFGGLSKLRKFLCLVMDLSTRQEDLRLLNWW